MAVVKAEGGGGKRAGGFAPAAGSCASQKSTYKGLIKKIEDATFTCGLSTDAATFEESTDAIARYIAREMTGGVQLSKALRDGELPTIDIPKKPKKETGAERRIRTDRPCVCVDQRGQSGRETKVRPAPRPV